jgi:dihydroorotate dehydrogenase electron transfer subunit
MELCQVIERRKVADSTFRYTLASPFLARAVRPGNFINIRVSPSLMPLWRRPFSVHDTDPSRGQVDILFQVVGEGTRILSCASVGAELDVFGPLGNSFPLPPPGSPAVLVAGGLGIAPFLFLSRALKANGSPTHLLYGARSRSRLVELDGFQALGVEIRLATEDGSAGVRGTVVDLLQETETDLPPEAWHYVCGPLAAVSAIGRELSRRQGKVWVSLETTMACGFGACMGCAVKARGDRGYHLVCKDGPVFELSEVELW